MTLSYIFATFICWINCCRVIMLIIAGYLMQHKFFREFPLKLTNTQNKLQECLPLNQCFLFEQCPLKRVHCYVCIIICRFVSCLYVLISCSVMRVSLETTS